MIEYSKTDNELVITEEIQIKFKREDIEGDILRYEADKIAIQVEIDKLKGLLAKCNELGM